MGAKSADITKTMNWLRELRAENKQLRAKLERVEELSELRSKLLVCYRVGKRPSGKMLDRMRVLTEKGEG